MVTAVMRGRIARGGLVTAVTEAVPVADRPPCHHRRDHGRDHSRDDNSTPPHARAEGEEEEKRWAVDGTGAVTAVTAPNHARPARDRLEAPRAIGHGLDHGRDEPPGSDHGQDHGREEMQSSKFLLFSLFLIFQS